MPAFYYVLILPRKVYLWISPASGPLLSNVSNQLTVYIIKRENQRHPQANLVRLYDSVLLGVTI